MSEGKDTIKTTLKSIGSPAVDWKLCLKLANNKASLAQEILTLIVQQLPDDIHAIKAAQEMEDYAEQLRCTHKLHGALCYSGMPRLKAVVSELESLLKKGQFEKRQLLELTQRLDEEVEAVLASSLPVEE